MALSDFEHTQGKPRCSVGRAYLDLDPDDSETLRNWIEGTEKTGSWIERAMKGFGYPLGSGAARRHRNGDCACL